jgi:hypothetical protein
MKGVEVIANLSQEADPDDNSRLTSISLSTKESH